jgi:hypothetical protein
MVAEVLRCCTDGTRNACSWLYGAAARIAAELGFERIQTFVLDSESGVSLNAAGWKRDGEVSPPVNGWKTRRWGIEDELFQTDKEHPQGAKVRWVKHLRAESQVTEPEKAGPRRAGNVGVS